MLVRLILWLASLLTAGLALQSKISYRPPGSSTRSAASSRHNLPSARPLPHSCTFEEPCSWKSSTATRVVTGQEVNNSWVPHPRVLPPGPFADASNNTHGHFLYTYVKNASGAKEVVLRSPRFVRASEKCRVEVSLHMSNMNKGFIKLVIEATNQTSWVAAEKEGNNLHAWTLYSFPAGRIRQEFNIILEIVPANKYPYHIAIDNIILVNCFPDPPQNVCSSTQFQCTNGTCIDSTKICNINKDCPNGEDELQDCDKVQDFARCTFESGLCGWHNAPGNLLNWTKNNGSTATSYTGPNFDHTYQNDTGVYLYVDMTGKLHELGTAAALESPIINPPPKYHSNSSSPYYNSCFITFHYHKYGPHSGSLGLFLIELQRNNNVSTKLWWSYGDKGEKWLMQVVTLPNITVNRYYLQFEARKSFASRGDPAIDDISMSPRCFGIGVPAAHLDGYNYTSGFLTHEPPPPPVIHQDFANSTVYTIGTCGKKGRTGPTPENCTVAYNNTNINISVLTDRLERGIQRWTVPETGLYTIIAKGASGGKGSDAKSTSYGSIVRGVIELVQGQQLYILVGQQGNDACKKAFASTRERIVCKQETRDENQQRRQLTPLEEIIILSALPEGGGGGGATYIYMWHKKKKEKEVVLVAGGGGGMAHGSSQTDTFQNGHGINSTLLPTTGDAYGRKPAGAGGGWMAGNFTYRDITGLALLQGGTGGKACYTASDGSDRGAGGFGGGGGGCTAGGGGGGYTGGRAWGDKSKVGEGGYSWVGVRVSMPKVWRSQHKGAGEVLIIPSLPEGCSCDYRCIALDMHRSKTKCVCPSNWILGNDTLSCLIVAPTVVGDPAITLIVAIILTGTVIFLILIILFIFIYLYNNYQKKKAEEARLKLAQGPDLQLNRLRGASDGMVTEFNPNYEFAGAVARANDLKEVPRERLRLVKALGQGAFGEVYQGFFKNRAGDTVEMPVAVKTLPELSTNQNESDFWMEARIMSKFDHPNIVHFIGVCFDRHPRYIVIELLAGGDLKTFLRENRPKPERASPLIMRDLMTCIMDVAKGCKYLADCRFIHRDIAARNCLLTSKGPGRVVKIADFGMARDIYRQDYYKKGGKAMLPIKWMPPEAFLDGLFTSKTDVWSFGVLMWEVLSLGYMPYTGCANREVMQLVTSGGRLEPPNNCPTQIYGIMTNCWHPNPDERPTFTLLLERLGYCTQDPDVMNATLPLYTNPPSAERDMTLMRPRNDPLQPDYLIPLPGGTTWPTEIRPTQPLLTPPNQDKQARIFTVSHNITQDIAEITC